MTDVAILVRTLRSCSRLFFTLTMLMVAACAGSIAPYSSDLRSDATQVHSCARWFSDLDDAVDHAGVRDAGTHRIPGYPYLRVDRITASFAPVAASNDQAFATWLARMEALDQSARHYEIANLPGRAQTLGVAEPADIEGLTNHCAAILRQSDLDQPDARARLILRARVPDDYNDWDRLVGLYPLVSIPFAQGVDAWQTQARAEFKDGIAAAADTTQTVRYAPRSGAAAADVQRIVAGARRDALGIPQLSAADRATLLAAYAPVFAVATNSPFDRLGSLVWRGDETPSVDADAPTVYQDIAFTRFNGNVLIQLVYTAWFRERPTNGPFDMLGGSLDGVVLRVTLDEDGQPLIYDSIHPCGCFHMFFPTDRLTTRPAENGQREWAFVPFHAPALVPPQRIVVSLQSATHAVVGLAADNAAPATPYALIDYDSLRALTIGEGSRSAFGPDGLVPGTERGERLLFWPMGIESAGAMRQWGHHATAFAGRRHFDDPDLIERRFEFASPAAVAFDQSHAAWQALLERHVVVSPDGTWSRVDYAGFQADRQALASYLSQVSAVDEATYAGWTADDRLAFLVNAYNAYTIELILSRYPDLVSIRDLGSTFNSPWKEPFFRLLGERRSLDDIEHGMIRKKGVFDDPRVHFALVCASVGCPMLRNEAYVGDRLNAQLDDSMRRFLADRSRNRYDTGARKLEVSRIFDWYGGDFATGSRGFTSVAETLALFADELADSPDDRALVRAGRVPVEFLDYDWRLNDTRLPVTAAESATSANRS